MVYSKMGLNARFAGYHKLCRSVERNSTTHRRKFALKRNSRGKEGKKTCEHVHKAKKKLKHTYAGRSWTACQWLDVAP
jgi:hypothetical protein